MKDMVNERLIQLSSAQECLIQAAEIMDQLNRSQQLIEKHSYEAMNSTDKVLSLSIEGKKLVHQLRDGGIHYTENPCPEAKETLIKLMDDINNLLNIIIETATVDNEILHSIEHVADKQCCLTENLKNSVNYVSKSVDQAVACAELVMAMEI